MIDPLLLTATINPKLSNTPLTVIKDEKTRLKQYQDNLQRIIDEGISNKIVLCENTDYPLEEVFKEEVSSAKSKGIELELISFKGNYPEISKRGKGFGEGEIIVHAINESQLMQSSTSFYKLSGRLQLSNLQALLSHTQNMANCFIRYELGKPLVDTRFFKCSINFYKSELIDIHYQTDDEKGIYLEKVFYDQLIGKKEINCFPILPSFRGLSGSTGLPYDQKIHKRLVKSIALKLGFYKL